MQSEIEIIEVVIYKHFMEMHWTQ